MSFFSSATIRWTFNNDNAFSDSSKTGVQSVIISYQIWTDSSVYRYLNGRLKSKVEWLFKMEMEPVDASYSDRGTEKIADRPSQTDGPLLPVKSDSSLNVQFEDCMWLNTIWRWTLYSFLKTFLGLFKCTLLESRWSYNSFKIWKAFGKP